MGYAGWVRSYHNGQDTDYGPLRYRRWYQYASTIKPLMEMLPIGSLPLRHPIYARRLSPLHAAECYHAVRPLLIISVGLDRCHWASL